MKFDRHTLARCPDSAHTLLMSNANVTPGFSSRIVVSFSADKNGKKIAYYLAGSCAGMVRKVRMSAADAEQFVAMGLADLAAAS